MQNDDQHWAFLLAIHFRHPMTPRLYMVPTTNQQLLVCVWPTLIWFLFHLGCSQQLGTTGWTHLPKNFNGQARAQIPKLLH